MVPTNFTFNEIYKRGFVSFTIPDQLLQSIKHRLFTHITNNFQDLEQQNHNLVGNIKNEYSFRDFEHELFPFVEQAAYRYTSEWHKDVNIKVEYTKDEKGLNDLWVNFQQKYEYNPPHYHAGTYSFVIWIHIPYDLPQELQRLKMQNIRQAEDNPPGTFRFLYPDHFSKMGISMHNIYVDKSYEGAGVLFEAGTMHMVNPFYLSDGYRISIAGNLNLINE